MTGRMFPGKLMAALLFLTIVVLSGLAAPAAACTPGAGSTFCADGWISAPVTREREHSPDPGPPGGDAAMAEGEVWVDGAIPVDTGAPPDDEGL